MGHVFSEEHELHLFYGASIFQYASWGLEYIQRQRCKVDFLQCCCLQSRHWRVGHVFSEGHELHVFPEPHLSIWTLGRGIHPVSEMLLRCLAMLLPSIKDIGGWDMSSVKDMNQMFYGATSFNMASWCLEYIQCHRCPCDVLQCCCLQSSHWSVGHVFSEGHERTCFTEPHLSICRIGAWNTSSVTDVHSMFYNAAAFNQDIGGWDMSLVKNMSHMFDGARHLLIWHIGAWNTSSVRDVTYDVWQCCCLQSRHWRVGHVFSEEHEPNVLRSNIFQYGHWGLEYIQCHTCY